MRNTLTLVGLAFIFAIGVAFCNCTTATGMIRGRTLGTIINPVNTTITPCLIQPGTKYKIGVLGVDFNVYNTNANAEAEDSVRLLKL